MKAKITKRLVDTTNPQDRDVFVWDTEVHGFGLKVTPGGRKVYILQYRMGGRGHPTRRYTIGNHGGLTPDQARDISKKLRGQIAGGKDPIEIEKDERRKEAEARADQTQTFGKLAEQYIEKECPNLARGSDVESVIRRQIIPALGSMPCAQIRMRDALPLIDDLLASGKPAAAHKLREIIRRLGHYLVEQDIGIDVSPFARRTSRISKVERDRKLRDDEIAALWKACETVGYPFGPLVELLILTGQRRNEVGGMIRGEVDLGKAEWIIPANRSKNDKPHLVPLSDPALAVMKALPGFDGPHLFTTTDGQRPVSGFSKAKRRLDSVIAEQQDGADIDPWRLHDLRRTCRSSMAALGVPEIVSEKVLNHQPDKLARTYNVHEYRDEKRNALERWARHVTGIVRPVAGKVVELRSIEA